MSAMKACSVSTAAMLLARSWKATPCWSIRPVTTEKADGVGAVLHLGLETRAQPLKRGIVAGQRIGDRGAHDLGAFLGRERPARVRAIADHFLVLRAPATAQLPDSQ